MNKYSVVSVMMLLAVTTAVFAANPPVQTNLPSVSAQSDGGPIAWCRPNVPCDPKTEVKQVASDGGPIAWCRPNVPCDPRTGEKQVASDGGPIAWCRPNVPCDPLAEVKQLASSRALMVKGLTLSL
jgi:hypothetical protein